MPTFFAARPPSATEKRICERFWPHLKTTQWSVIGDQDKFFNCFGYAVGEDEFLEEVGTGVTDGLNEAFVYRKRKYKTANSTGRGKID